jgi:hypothetical protein
VTLQSWRDADAERPMDAGETLLGSVVATPRPASLNRVRGVDRLSTPLWAMGPAIKRDLAGDWTANG